VFVVVSLAGGVLLLWMAFSMLNSLPQLHLNFTARSEKSNSLIAAGVLFSLANPYWLIWWASIGLGYITHSLRLGIPGVLSFFLGHILADLLWYTLVSLVVNKGRRYCSDTAYRGVVCVCAVFLIIFAGYFLYSGTVRFIGPASFT
jgi:threonine/homoserine/homoserine lactone efflux protein